jgi:hypothetical protein
MRRLLSVSTVGGWKLIATVAALIVDVEGVWIVSRVIPGLSDSLGPTTGGETTVLAHPQLLYYPAIALMALLGTAGLFLLAYALTLLEKRIVVLRRFSGPADKTEL